MSKKAKTEIYILIKRCNESGGYLVPYQDAADAFGRELDNYLMMHGPDASIKFEVSEMTMEDYETIPKYDGFINRGGYGP
jgi:hypothetical protein